LAQMMVYDAQITEAEEAVEVAIERARVLESEMGWYQGTSELNPLSMEGMKTISYEIAEQGEVPDWVVVAMGSGVTISALWKGFKELRTLGLAEELPRLIGVQAAGCAPIASAFEEGSYEPLITHRWDTEASAIRVAEPIYGEIALRAVREPGGLAVMVTDEGMLEAGREIARLEGIFPEAASAATVACLGKLLEERKIDPGDRVACIITSSGLKSDDILQSLTKRRKSQGLGSMLTTKEKILRHISGGETYGYEAWKTVGKGMTMGAVYQHIADLESRGLVSSTVRGKRKYYEVTETGRRVLAALDELQVLL